MPTAIKPDGIHVTPRVVTRLKQHLEQQTRCGNVSSNMLTEINDLLDDTRTIYPPSYGPLQRGPVWTLVQRKCKGIASGFNESVNTLFGTYLPRSNFVFNAPVSEPILQQIPQQVTDPVTGSMCWKAAMRVPNANPQLASIAEGFTVHFSDQGLTYTRKVASFTGAGLLKGIPSFHMGTPLSSKLDPDHNVSGRCYNMAVAVTRALPEHIDAALAALDNSTQHEEIRSAIQKTYASAWFGPYEKAENILALRDPDTSAAAVSLSSIIWHNQNIYFAQSGLNSLTIVRADCVDTILDPVKQSKAPSSRQHSREPWSEDLHNRLQSAGFNKGNFSSDLKGYVRPSLKCYSQASLAGSVVIISNIRVREYLSSEEIMRYCQDIKDSEDLATHFAQTMRQRGELQEIQISVLNFSRTISRISPGQDDVLKSNRKPLTLANLNVNLENKNTPEIYVYRFANLPGSVLAVIMGCVYLYQKIANGAALAASWVCIGANHLIKPLHNFLAK
jgi:hypothetical protein